MLLISRKRVIDGPSSNQKQFFEKQPTRNEQTTI